MKKASKVSNLSKRIISLIMLFIQTRAVGAVSNIFNTTAVDSYHEIIESFADFLQSEGIDNPQQIYEYYNYAMWNGYFSRNHKLQYTEDRDVYLDNAGMGIMSGNGVCLNYADMLSLLFEEMGYNSNMTMCYVDPYNVKIQPIRTDKSIERNIDSGDTNFFIDPFVEIFTKITGNHAITCVEKNGELYFFDPTNLIYLNKTGINNVSIINGQGKFDLRYFTSLLFENINVFKIATYKNDLGYQEEVFEKEEININVEALEEFYNKEKDNIEKVAQNNDKNNSILSMSLYILLVTLIIDLIKKLSTDLAKKIYFEDIKNLLPKMKYYLNENNIKTEFEILKNFELLETQIGIKHNVVKYLLEKILEILDTDHQIHLYILKKCLVELGYNSNIIYAKKYSNKFHKKVIPVIIYSNNDNIYIYDYETEELLCRDNDNVLCSIDGKYKYDIGSYYDDEFNIANRELIQEKMNNENTMLKKENIKLLKR